MEGDWEASITVVLDLSSWTSIGRVITFDRNPPLINDWRRKSHMHLKRFEEINSEEDSYNDQGEEQRADNFIEGPKAAGIFFGNYCSGSRRRQRL